MRPIVQFETDIVVEFVIVIFRYLFFYGETRYQYFTIFSNRFEINRFIDQP